MIGFGFWFVSVFAFAAGLYFCFSFLSISLEVGADDDQYCQNTALKNQRGGIEYHDSTRSISIKESGVCFIHLLPFQRRRNVLVFTCTLDSNMAD